MTKKLTSEKSKKTSESTQSNKVIISSLDKALKKGDLKKFLTLLGKLAKQFGMTEFSRLSDVDRVHLYTIFAAKQCPRLNTTHKILDVLGLELSVAVKKKRK